MLEDLIQESRITGIWIFARWRTFPSTPHLRVIYSQYLIPPFLFLLLCHTNFYSLHPYLIIFIHIPFTVEMCHNIVNFMMTHTTMWGAVRCEHDRLKNFKTKYPRTCRCTPWHCCVVVIHVNVRSNLLKCSLLTHLLSNHFLSWILVEGWKLQTLIPVLESLSCTPPHSVPTSLDPGCIQDDPVWFNESSLLHPCSDPELFLWKMHKAQEHKGGVDGIYWFFIIYVLVICN